MEDEKSFERDELIEGIVNREWDFFSQVNNVGGPASCQNSPDTFSIMRHAWLSIWPKSALESYAGDLDAAQAQGRNPLTEKYAYMMADTHPDEYAHIKGQLPFISQEKAEAVEKVLAIEMVWAEEMAIRYPRFMAHGRPVHISDATPGETSVETYSRGELKTLSTKTLEQLATCFEDAASEGRNLQEVSDNAQVQAQGWKNLDAVEEALAR